MKCRSRALWAGITFFALVAGCSSGGSAETASNSPDDTSAATTTTSPRTNAADKALADRAVLKLSDFPPGWTSEASEDENSDAVNKQLTECFHIEGPKLVPDASNVDSDDFNSSSDQTVTNTVSVAASASDIGKAFNP